jgi:glycosyltransferase involved in cell wall biosynthesis
MFSPGRSHEGRFGETTMSKTNTKRVLVVGPGISERGGISSVLRLHLKTAAWGAMNCRLLATYRDGSTPGKARTAMFAYLVAPFLIGRADLVHIHLAGQASLLRKIPIALCAKAFGKPLVIHVHACSPESLFERTPAWAYRFVLRSASRVIALSESWAGSIRRQVPEAKVVVIPNPVIYMPAKPTAITRKRQIVLFVGRLETRKGYQDLLSAAPLVLRHYPEAQFWFAGHGDLERAEALARKLAILKSVRLLGWTEGSALTRLYMDASIFCLPSHNEGVPMSALEAMSHSLPVVCTPVGGLPELIQHGHNGLLATVGSPESIAQQICTLLANSKSSNRIGAAGADTVQRTCGLDLVSRRLQALYDEVVGAEAS